MDSTTITVASGAGESHPDACDVGVLLLDEDRRPTEINSAARQILAAGDGLAIRYNNLVAVAPEDQLAIQTAFRELDANDSGEPMGSGSKALLVHRAGRRPLTISLSGPSQNGGELASYLLLLVDPERDMRSSVRTICALYHMTRAETDLAERLVEGATLAEAAKAKDLQLATARAYLKQMFARTGVHRQAALVHLLLTSRIPQLEFGYLTTVSPSADAITRPSRASS